jgi:sugar phosphate isomerase/epimerase
MRLGGFFTESFASPREWVDILRGKGYRAAYAPFRPAPGGSFPTADAVRAYKQAADEADILIAEVGAWERNYLAEDEGLRALAVEESIRLLEMAEVLGARCLVNSAGWRQNPADNFSDESFRRIVETAQTIIDAVDPQVTAFTLELVPDVFPHSCDSYLDLISAVNRKGFGVHLDLANVTVTPYLLYHNTELVMECVQKLGPYIKSCHAKDVIRRKGMVVHLDETRPGLGHLDYAALLCELHQLDPDIPLMMEHLEGNDEYALAADYLRSCAASVEVTL